MKRLVQLFLVVLVGLALGTAVAVLRLWAVPWQGYVTGGPDDPRLAARAQAGNDAPKVVIRQTEHEFGAMDMDREGRFDFVFTNAGQGLLRLGKGPTSCGCTLSELHQTEIAPGGSAKVAIVWKAKKTPGVFRETATILTNDPARDQVVLTVSGRMVPAIEVVPPELSLGQLSVSQSASGEVRVFGFRPERLAILGHGMSDPATADRFSVQADPLSATEIRQKPDAISGFRILIKVKSGLPLGAIRQTIRLTTNYRDRPPAGVFVEGMVTSDLAVFAEGWNAETNVLNLGTISGQTGLRQNVVIVARGPRAKDVHFKLIAVRPSLLKVSVGKTIRSKDRPVAQTILSIEVPPKTPPANFIGSAESPTGEIVIATGHPEVPQLKIKVSFLVEG